MKIRTGDNVIVLTGKDKGKTGKVIKAMPRLGTVVVAGVHIVKRHTKPKKTNQKGQIVDKPLPIDASNVSLIDPKSGKSTRTGRWEDRQDDKVWKQNRLIDLPKNEKMTTQKKIKDLQKEAFKELSAKLGYKNSMQAPRLTKVVVSTGIGSLKDKKKADLIADRLMKITGQKPATRPAKKSIASFKVRQGDPSGFQVTLRGTRMFGFLDKFLNVALPRTKDFRGIPETAVDDIGNVTVGIREHTIFPETSDEDIKDVFGLSVTAVTTAGNREEGRVFLRYIGFPFRSGKAN
jgi:large subunit ribosomal protein L5